MGSSGTPGKEHAANDLTYQRASGGVPDVTAALSGSRRRDHFADPGNKHILAPFSEAPGTASSSIPSIPVAQSDPYQNAPAEEDDSVEQLPKEPVNIKHWQIH